MRKLVTLFAFIFCLSPSVVMATERPSRSIDTILEVADLTAEKPKAAIQLDLAALEALSSQEIVTSTLWTNGVNRFQGVPLQRLITELGLEGDRLRAVSMNDFSTQISLNDAEARHAIVAYRMNGKEMPRRAKGPLWIIYPFDQSARFRTETIYARAIWQLNRIEVID